MGSEHEGRARIVVVSRDAADTLQDCLEGVAELDLTGVDVVVVDLDSSDGSADVAIRHPVPHTVVVVPSGSRDLVLDAASRDVGLRPLVLLPADRRPTEGWLDAALAGLEAGWVVVGADDDVDQLAVDRVHLQHVALLDGVETTADLERRVRDAGGTLVHARGMRTVAARRATVAPSAAPLPAARRLPAGLPRYRGSISVVLCTRGRPTHLARCLASLDALDDGCHEVIVIDNHDVPTVPVAGGPPKARVVHEPRRGLDVARNRGLAEARSDVVAYIDDDCEADPGWLDALRVALADPRVDGVTGRVRPASLAGPPQRWFEAQFSFDRGTVGRRFTPWDRRPWYPLWPGGIGTGCNMAFRRAALEGIGGFDEILDMGTTIGGGGDLDVFARLLDAGSVMEYTPAALVWHHHRATEEEARRQFWGYGVSVGAVLTKALIERRRWRIAAVRFFVDRFVQGARGVRHAVPGGHLVPLRLLLLDLAGQWVGVGSYLRARRRAAARR
jgi:glycosyltransferase involved in cell wall biosynthesis